METIAVEMVSADMSALMVVIGTLSGLLVGSLITYFLVKQAWYDKDFSLKNWKL